VWLTLEQLFSFQSQARIICNLEERFSTRPIANYFQKAQSLANMLAAIGQPLQESEIVSYILAGLSADRL